MNRFSISDPSAYQRILLRLNEDLSLLSEWAGEGSAVKRPAGDLEGQYTSNSASCSPRLNSLAVMACIICLAACICGTARMWLE
ncbi:hypothetical protein FOYG_07248 [Fusarium oxysporum NRRL 32931]|uniref:Uncharacterized protein n=1 Tax=Fusarium oxysporum NRRL 32931 TaxID=660029 RepID=W9IIY6_FUSOX|nr:hypothetical protein FOYG_07248 [Fusarium oxysporum NRRL 32931]